MPEAKALAEPLPVSSNHEESSPGQKLISDSDSQVLLCPRRPIMPAGGGMSRNQETQTPGPNLR